MENIYREKLYKEVNDCDITLEIVNKKKLLSNNKTMQEMFNFMQTNSIKLLLRHKEILLKEIQRINNIEMIIIKLNQDLKRKREEYKESEVIYALNNIKKKR